MRTPKNTSRLPRERTLVIDFPPNSSLNPGASDIELYTLPNGAKDGDSITLTPIANSTGTYYPSQVGAGQLAWTAAASSATEFKVVCANVGGGSALDRPAMRLRVTFRRP